MSSIPLLRARIRALFVVFFCIAFLGLASWWASSQRATGRANHSVALQPDKGGITTAASTIVVNSTGDTANGGDGLCTLREAITAANNNAASGAVAGECAAGSSSGSDTIDFSVTGTINLTGALPDIPSDLTINGPGSIQLTVRRSTAGLYRIFNITSGIVGLSGLTIRDGQTMDSVALGDGGGILNAGTTTLNDVVVTSNRTSSNALARGAGISNLGTLTMTNCSVTGNITASGPTPGQGGGIYNSGTLTMTNCLISGNTTGGNISGTGGTGGGIRNDGQMTLTGTTISNNVTGYGSPGSFGGQGGGIYNATSTQASLVNCTVSGNVTGSGPGASQGNGGGIASTGPLNIHNSTVSGNQGLDGGGLYVVGNATLVTNSTITGNSSASGGGGIYSTGSLTLTNCVVSDNTAGGQGGGVNNNNGILKLTNSTISGNSSAEGGGIDSGGSSASLTLTNCTITRNLVASNTGNGVASFSGSLSAVVRNTIVASNGASGNGPDLGGDYTSRGHNLIGNPGASPPINGSTGFTNGINGDQVGTPGSPLDPHLGPLANNGGPTMTHALLSSSTALDAGDDCVNEGTHCGDAKISQLSTDQRGVGFSRRVDGPDADSTSTVDIGAYEMQTPLANLSDRDIFEDTQLVTAFDLEDTSTITSVTATSSNTGLVPNDSAHRSVVASGSTGVVTINPATNQNGFTDITVTVNRTSGSQSETFVLVVNPVNDPPSFTKGPDLTTNEDNGPVPFTGWATNISPGPADEAGQAVSFQITGNTNAALFSAGPSISSTGTLTYTPAANANGTATITIALMDNDGTVNGGVDTSPSQTFTITVNPINDAPSFIKGADQAANEDAGAQTVNNWATSISPGPNETGQTVSFTATNDNNTLFSTQPAISSTGTLTYTPAANTSGAATVTVTLKDNGGTANGGVDTSAPQTFTITVNAVNDAPLFTKGANQTVNEDDGAQTVAGWATSISAGPADESGQTLTFQVTGNTNSALFSAGPAISSTGTLTYTPAANANGSATITINLKDNGGTANGGVDTSASQSFTITVNAVNDAPSFTKGADQVVNEDAGAQSVVNWATAISRGPADEAAQTLTFQVISNSNAALFSSQPAISATGTLTYTPVANVNGSATITINLKDNGGTANSGVDTSASQSFTITVNAVNDAPSFTKGLNQTVNEDAGAQTVNNWATAISAGPADEVGQTLTFQVTGNTNTALFSAVPLISATGTLTYTPAADANGSATLTINLKDSGGTANGGVDTSASQTFTITVNAVNDVPSFSKGADQTVNNNAGAQTVNNWATAISAGPANESGQTLTFQITNNTNSSLFSSGPAISSTGTLTYTPAANTGGTATITVNLKDNGGTANGGVDTSASQTFTITVTPIGGFISFAAASSNTTESSGFTTVTVNRTGDTTLVATVDYATNAHNGLPCSNASGVASPKCDFTTAQGTLSFAAGETSKTITVLISQDSFVEGPETITVTLSNQTGGSALGTPSTASITVADVATEPSTNPIDDVRNFVRQHYHDFLNREPDASGWDFWTNQITSCGSDAGCNEVRRIDVSASFFLSIEFQQSGYLVERFYKAAYGDATGTSNFVSNHQLNVPIVRFSEFLKDTQRIGKGVVVLAPGWEQALENNKQAYALEFVQTTRFTTALPTTLNPTQFVDRLNQNTGGVLSVSERAAVINLFGGSADSSNVTARAQAMRMVADDTDLYNAEFNRAFVLAEYFGYLRRNPNDAPETTLDYTGYDFWLTKLNQFNGNYINAEMVKAFLSSIEYRQRFGP